MSNDSSATVSSILVMLGNVQHENFHQMREMMVKFFEKVKSIETHLEDIERKLSNSSNASITASSSVQSSSSSESRKFSPLRNQFLMSSPKSSDEEDPQEVPKTPGKNLDLASLGFAGTSSPPPRTQHHTEIFCFDCNRTFVRGSGEFSRHVRETSCKPYQCHCGKLFKKKSSLTAHESTHSTAVVACDCGAIFRCEVRVEFQFGHRLALLFADSFSAILAQSQTPQTS